MAGAAPDLRSGRATEAGGICVQPAIAGFREKAQ